MKFANVIPSLIVFHVFVLVLGGICDANQSQRKAAVLKNQARNYYWGTGVSQDYSRALDLYEMAAALGDPQASAIAGGMYHTGKGTDINPYRAFDYLDYSERAGETNPDASAALAGYYLQGRVAPLNYARAVELYSSAAEAGNPEAQLELGFLYYNGYGVDQDFSKAHKWFNKAALGNQGLAQYNLGIMWYTGNNESNSTSLADAYAWMSIAVSNNVPGAYGFRRHLESTLTKDQLKLAQQKSTYLFNLIKSSKINVLSDR